MHTERAGLLIFYIFKYGPSLIEQKLQGEQCWTNTEAEISLRWWKLGSLTFIGSSQAKCVVQFRGSHSCRGNIIDFGTKWCGKWRVGLCLKPTRCGQKSIRCTPTLAFSQMWFSTILERWCAGPVLLVYEMYYLKPAVCCSCCWKRLCVWLFSDKTTLRIRNAAVYQSKFRSKYPEPCQHLILNFKHLATCKSLLSQPSRKSLFCFEANARFTAVPH